jgi:SAM-dependent methyltransferase
LAECLTCESKYIDPRPSIEDVASFYVGYATHEDPGSVPTALYPSPLSARARARRRREVLPPGMVQRRGRLFEVGCGNGINLAVLREQGWEVVGQDFDPVAREAASRQRIETLVDITEARPGSFDVVLLAHVLEHFDDPQQALRDSWPVLKSDGVLVAYTPNVTSWAARVLGRRWRGLEVPRHLQIFSPSSLCGFLEANGWEVVSVATGYESEGYLFANSLIASHGRLQQQLRRVIAVAAQIILDLVSIVSPLGGSEIAVVARPAHKLSTS